MNKLTVRAMVIETWKADYNSNGTNGGIDGTKLCREQVPPSCAGSKSHQAVPGASPTKLCREQVPPSCAGSKSHQAVPGASPTKQGGELLKIEVASHEESCNRMMANIIRQLSSLGRHADDIFDNLNQSIFEREDDAEVKRLQYSGTDQEWQSKKVLEDNFFSLETRPGCVQQLYDACEPIPQFQILQGFRDDGKDGYKLYSDPRMFFEDWSQQKIEEAMQSQMQRKQTKKVRKDGLKNQRKNYKLNKIETKAEQIRRKEEDAGNVTQTLRKKEKPVLKEDTFSDTKDKREEADPPTGKLAKKKSKKVSISNPIVKVGQIEDGKPNLVPLSMVGSTIRESFFVPPPPDDLLQDDFDMELYELPTPPPPLGEDFYPSPKLQVEQMGAIPPPPPLPPPPMASGPPPPPLPPPQPIAGSLEPPPVPSANSGSTQSLLLQQIQEGRQLKKVEHEPKQMDERCDLLKQIRDGKQLKKVKVDLEHEKKQNIQKSLNTVGDILAMAMEERFGAIQGSESDSDYFDDDFDDQDFDE
eukprot:maker-scaffold161_size295871-snap-gene-1.27 protein:Tk05101 transcript:maker-scaffold161_size295871-snap-gene-1.27-mRNA-1 annotation:"GI20586"